MVVGQGSYRLHVALKQWSPYLPRPAQAPTSHLTCLPTLPACSIQGVTRGACTGRLRWLAGPGIVRCASSDTQVAELIEEKNAESDVVIYSKSYCPFSAEVKSLFKKIKVEYKAFELDEIVEGEDVLDALMDKTSSRTVPQVFIKGQYIGGCDDTLKKYKSGELKELFESGGVAASF